MIYLQADIGSAIGGMWPILLMFVVIYFFMIRPQSKKNKEQRNFEDQMKKGDEIVTNSGIVGRLNKIDEQTVSIQVDGKTYLTLLKSAISKEMTDSYVNGGDKKDD